MSVLVGPSAKQLEVIQSELNENEDKLEGNVRDLKVWCASQSHMPEINDDHLLRVFLRGCRHDVLRTRSKLECFCRARADSRDLYDNRQLTSEHIRDVVEYLDIVALPRLTEDGCRITLFRFKPSTEEVNFNLTDLLKYIFLLVDVRMHDECAIAGDVFVWDVVGARASFAARAVASAGVLRKAFYLAHAAYPQRLKRLYLLNAAPFMASAISLMRSFLKEKIRNRFILLPSLESLHEHISRDLLPCDYGGAEPDVNTLVKRWRQRVTDLQAYLTSLDRLKAIGPRPDNGPKNQDGLFGTEGAFRTLNID